NGAAAGFIGKFFGNIGPPAVARVVNEKNVHDGVGSLRGFDGFLETNFTAFVLRVGDDDEGLSSGFRAELFRASEIDRVIKMRAAGVGWNCSRRDHTAASDSIDLRFVNGALNDVLVVREITEQIHVE